MAAMMPTGTVTKGNEYQIDQFNQWMRAQPWYQQFLQQQGQRPDSVRLSKAQSRQLLRLAQANGMRVDEGSIEVDPAGNFNPIGHKLRNGLIAGAIGGAAVAAPFALGALGAGGGSAATGAGMGGLGGLAPASYVVPGASLGAAGGLGAGAAAGAAGGLGGLAPASYTVPSATLGANGGIRAAKDALTHSGGLPNLLRSLAPVAGVLAGKALPGGGGGGQLSPELQQLLAQAMKRMSQQQPLFESINAQAMAGLPTAYQR